MRRTRSGDRRRRLLAGGIGLGLLASLTAATTAAAQEPAAPPEPAAEEPIQAPADWSVEPTQPAPDGTPPATDPTAPAADPAPPTTGTPSTEAPAPTSSTSTTSAPTTPAPDTAAATAAAAAATIVAPPPIVGAANPFAGTHGFAVLVTGDAAVGGSSAGPVAAGGDLTAAGYTIAGSTSSFGDTPVGALAGGSATGALTTDPAAAVVVGVADPAGPPGAVTAPGVFDQAFAGVGDDLSARSTSLATLPSSVTPTDVDGTALDSLDGADVHLALQPGLTTWTVAADELASIAGLTVEPAPSATQPLVITVTGGDVTLAGPITAPTGSDAGLLWNLPDATTATVGADLPGSVLAPGASVTLGADLGGTLVAASLDQQAPAAVGGVPFAADLPTPDEIAAAAEPGDPAAAVPAPDDPSIFLVPTPGAGQAVISAKVGGDRTGITGVTPLAGVVLQLYNGGANSGTTPVTDVWATCTSDADGDCSFIVPDTGTGGANANRRFWVRQVSAPGGWFANDDLKVGTTPTAPLLYEFRTPQGLSAGNTYLTTGPTASWMLGTGAGTRASGGIWQNSRANPALPPQCGLRVALVLDVSGSVPQAGVRTAGTAFVSGLGGTPSQVAVFTFADNAPANAGNNQNRPLTPVSTAAGVTLVNGWINGVTTGGGTNWDRGLAQVAASTTDFDIAVVVTDGDPTRYSQPFEGDGSTTRFREVENAIFSSNAIKAETTRVVTVGVGAGVSGNPINLAAVSGPIAGSDYIQTADYAAAAANLRALALGSCQGSISVVKQVVPNTTPVGSTTGAAPAGGWTFGATTATSGVTIAPPSGATADGTGALSFNLTFPGGTTTAPVTVTETVQPGFVLHQGVTGQNAVCTRLDTGASVPITNVAGGFTVSGSSTFPVSCLVYNRAPAVVVPASIQVNKSWQVNGVTYPDGSQPTGLTAELTLDGTAQVFGVPRTDLAAGDVVTIAETTTITPPLCTLAGSTITPVTPAGPAGTVPYDATLVGGANVYSITNTVTCQSQLTLEKLVLPDGAADPAAWSLNAAAPTGALAGPSGTTGVTSLVTPEALYTLSESGGDPRFAQQVGPNAVPIPGSTVSWRCVLVDENGQPIPPGTVFDGLNGGVRPPLGTRTTCTAINQAVPLTLVKQVVNDDGGTAVPADFQITATPVGPLPLPPGLGPVTVPGSATGTDVLVRPGVDYQISETGPGGYTLAGVVCTVTDNLPRGDGLVQVGFNQSGVCTLTNNDQPATLTLVKTVTNDNGGTAAPTAWTLAAGGPTPISGATGTAPVTAATVDAGTYTLSETGPAGYTPGAWTCTAGTLTGASLVLGPGVTATCTIDNNDQPATLTLVKTVTNDNGGTAAPTAWTLAAAGPTPISGATGTAPVTAATVDAGTYTLSETGPAGYTPGAWTCTAGTLTGASLVLGPGVSATCTIDNNDQPATLTLVKTVTNDNGGTAAPTAWTLAAAGPTPISGATGDPTVTAATVSAGTYTLSETGPAGYTPGAWTCTGGGTLAGDTLTLTPGVSATCTIDNNDQPATLTLVKTVTNDNGGTAAPTAWTLAAAGPTPISGATGDPAVTAATVDAGTYTLSETGPAGYTPGAWTCTAGTLTGASLVLGPGVSATCTIDNNDQPATLTLVKTVTNDNGGTAAPTAWTLAAAGPTPISGATGDPTVTAATVSAGTYTLSETGPAGYTPGAWTCTGGGTLAGDTLTLTPGVSATCTIHNDDVPASLTLVKIVDPGATGSSREPVEWTLTATPDGIPGQDPVSGSGDPTAPDGVDAVPISLGTYDLSEDGPAGFTADAWSCTGATVAGTTLTVDVAGDVRCTITNTAIAPLLTLVKVVDNGTTGTATATDWQLTAAGPVTVTGTSGSTAVTAATVEVGAYDLSETGPAGYTASDWQCTSSPSGTGAPVEVVSGRVTLAEGVEATCTIVNAAVPPTPPTTTPPTTAAAPPPEAAAPLDPCAAFITPVQSPRDDCEPLPFTGASVAGLTLAGAVLAGGGIALLVVRRRRRVTDPA